MNPSVTVWLRLSQTVLRWRYRVVLEMKARDMVIISQIWKRILCDGDCLTVEYAWKWDSFMVTIVNTNTDNIGPNNNKTQELL